MGGEGPRLPGVSAGEHLLKRITRKGFTVLTNNRPSKTLGSYPGLIVDFIKAFVEKYIHFSPSLVFLNSYSFP